MKKIYFLAAAALVFAACSNENVIDTPMSQDAIGFNTFKTNATRAAENSGATVSTGLEAFHDNFVVYGNKVIGTDTTWVFDNQQVNYGTDWTYSPIRYWDKSATNYNFYAAAPKAGWSFDKDTHKYSYSNLELTGAGVDTIVTTIDAQQVFGDYDLMISHDEEGYDTYTSAAVNLEFDHILTRINIGVNKADDLDTIIFTLNEVKLYNLYKSGNFDESAAVANTAGSLDRWTPSDKFTSGVGFASDSVLTETMTYYYQDLFIPQTAEYDSIPLDGSSNGTYPYINIKYTVTYPNATGSEEFSYFYNLADIFNGANSTDDVDFNEGFQNTLKITINPIAIEFDAIVYDWDNDKQTSINVPNE